MKFIAVIGAGALLLVLPFACAKYDVLYNRTARNRSRKKHNG